MTDPIARIEKLPLRSVWAHEARDFTEWLRDNIEILNEVTGLDLVSAESEQAAGSFNVDIVAESSSGRTVVIENQLERSDHDHLGKVITYLTTFDAEAAVWIVADARPEHLQAMAWLNEASGADFHLVKVEAISINDSAPAPLMTLLVGPSEEAKEIGRRKVEMAERHYERLAFWTDLLEIAKSETPMFSRIGPSKESWISTHNIPFSGMNLSYSARQHDTGGYVYIDGGPGLDAKNQAVYEALADQKAHIESAFGETMTWTPPVGRRSAVVGFKVEKGGYRDKESWPEIHRATIKAMQRFWAAIEPVLRDIPED